MVLDVYNIKGKKTKKQVKLPKEIFGISPNSDNASHIRISILSQIWNLFSGSQILAVSFLVYLGIIEFYRVGVNIFYARA